MVRYPGTLHHGWVQAMLGGIAQKNKAYFLMREMIKKEIKPLLSEERLRVLAAAAEDFLASDEEELTCLFDLIRERLIECAPRAVMKIDTLIAYLQQLITDKSDAVILSAVAGICFPESNKAVSDIPSGEAMVAARDIAKQELAMHGDSAISSLFTNWDNITYHACIAKENDIAVALENRIDNALEGYRFPMDPEVRAAMRVASLQEYERRAGQKRKGRAGEDLQQAVQTIFEHIGLNFKADPSLVTGTLEADLIVYGANGWQILVSCKRTGRERVKQISSDQNELTKNRYTKVIWFFTDFDQTDNRVTDLGVRGSVFYLPDESEDFRRLNSNPATSQYVRPLSGIRESIKEFFKP